VVTLLDSLKTREAREWYAFKSIEHDWSRNILATQIESRLQDRPVAWQSLTTFAKHFSKRSPAPAIFSILIAREQSTHASGRIESQSNNQ